MGQSYNARLFVIVLSFAAVASAQPSAAVLDRTQWKLDQLQFSDGKGSGGLILDENEDKIEFAEIVFPKGRPMFAVVRTIRRDSVAEINRLPGDERAVLISRYQAFKNRARIEAGRMEDLKLRTVKRDAARHWAYDGDWFALESSADEETTRRSIVRVDQVFRAYRQVLPPRTRREQRLRIFIHGSIDEYRDDLRRRGLQIENPAYYSVERNLISAGSDLARFAERLAEVRQQNQRLREHYESLDKEFNQRLRALSDELARNGFTDEHIRFEVRSRQAAWKAKNGVDGEYWEAMRKIDEINRRNEAKFADATRQMFVRLYHEAFHAYLENFVYPHDRFDVPRWLNEGLAQVFESGQLDGDTLRIDAPNRQLLSELKKDLGEGGLPLSSLLAADDREYLHSHEKSGPLRQYWYAWGLAHYLTFENGLLSDAALDRYVSPAAKPQPPKERFERLVGTDLPAFEVRWRRYIEQLEP